MIIVREEVLDGLRESGPCEEVQAEDGDVSPNDGCGRDEDTTAHDKGK